MAAASGMNPDISERYNDDRWRIGPVDSVRDSTVHALFEKVFGAAKPQSWWRWKYGEGRGLAMGAWRGGELVAHYAGFPRSVRCNGRTVAALQIGDVMVEPSARGLLTRRGPFQRCAAAFLESYLGAGRPYWLGFGFPHLRAMRLAERLGLYTRVDRMSEIQWSLLPDRPRWRTRIRALPVNDSREVLARLWWRMRETLSDVIVGVRNPDYWLHRYACHPEHQYHLFLLRQRFSGRELGVLVLRREGERCLWVDWVGDPASMGEAIFQARRLAPRFGSSLYTWASTPLVQTLSATGGRVEPLDVYIPSCAWTEGPDPEALRGRWWLMPGDTDFF